MWIHCDIGDKTTNAHLSDVASNHDLFAHEIQLQMHEIFNRRIHCTGITDEQRGLFDALGAGCINAIVDVCDVGNNGDQYTNVPHEYIDCRQRTDAT